MLMKIRQTVVQFGIAIPERRNSPQENLPNNSGHCADHARVIAKDQRHKSQAGEVMRNSLDKAALVGLFGLLAVQTSPAAAASWIITYTGHVSEGYDLTGEFGAANTSLNGAAFTSVYTLTEPTAGAVHYDGSGSSINQQYTYGSNAENPLSANITINGVTKAIAPGAYYGQAFQLDDVSIDQISHDVVEFGTRSLSNRIYNSVYSNGTNNIFNSSDYHKSLNYTLQSGDSSFGLVEFYSYNDITNETLHNAYGNLKADAVTIGPYGPPQPINATSPTTLQLAKLSGETYNSEGAGAIDSFKPVVDPQTGNRVLTGSPTNSDSIFAQAFVSPGQNGGRDQVVIAIRGTNLNTISNAAADFGLRNGTFLTGDSTNELNNNAQEVANLFAKSHSLFPDADFTVTGHSLGGALAQALGEAVNINAVGFDAPGAKDVFNESQRQIIAIFANSGPSQTLFSSNIENSNIRFYGDVVSTLGNPYPNVKTIQPFNDVTNNNLLASIPGSCFYACHGINNIIDALTSGNIPHDGIPDITTRWIPFTYDVAQSGSRKVFNSAITSSNLAFFDPSGLGEFVRLDLLDSDVILSSIYLPSSSGGSKIYYLDGGAWHFSTNSVGFEEIIVPQSNSYLFSNASGISDSFGNYIVGLKFNTTGTFRGSLTTISIDSGVPEPSTWWFMILGFGFVGRALRRKTSVTDFLSNTEK
jgi:hypothetical protein